MTETPTTPEDEAKAAALEQYAMVVAQSDAYGREPKILDVGDYLVIFVRTAKPAGRAFLMRLRRDDYPEVAAGQRGPLPVPCIKGHRDYYTGNPPRHRGWSNPPAHGHSLDQLVMIVRNAILDRWS